LAYSRTETGFTDNNECSCIVSYTASPFKHKNRKETLKDKQYFTRITE